jgi:hypothetical protein
MEIPLSTIEIVYEVVLYSATDPVPSQTDEEDPVLRTIWATSSSFSHDFLDDTLPLDQAILEAMNGFDMHHRTYFLLELATIEQDNFRSTLSEIVDHIIIPLDMHNIYAEGNMASMSPIVMIDISCIPGKIENVYIGAGC